MDTDSKHITCSIEILNSRANSSYSCSICSTVVKTRANLKAHLIKTHQIIESPADQAFYSKKKCKVHIVYHCPVDNCKYHISTGKGISKFSVLKQHYNWVHVPHAFICSSCNKSFGTAPALKYHEKNCGQRFTCSICNSDFSEEKFLTYHRNHIHFKKKENEASQKSGFPLIDEKSNFPNEHIKVLQPIYIPMIFPMNISDPAILKSMAGSTAANIELLNTLRIIKPQTRDAETQVEIFANDLLPYPQLDRNNNSNGHNNTSTNTVGCLSYDWQNIDSNGCQFFSGTSRDYLNSCCNASMQTVPYNSYDNFFNVETQTNLAGFIERDLDFRYGNISIGGDLMSSLFTDDGCLKPADTTDDLLRLADNHTQTAPYPIDMGTLVDLNDIETQTSLNDIDDLLFTD